jgi:peroxiredoxin
MKFMRALSACILTLGLCLQPIMAADPSARIDQPRPAPEFVISYPAGSASNPGSKQALLSSYKGKVVVLAFILTTCSHCQHECQVLSKLNTEFGSRGFQPLAVAVNDMALMLVPDFVRDYRVNFPVGASNREPLLQFMRIKAEDRWVVPQIAVIDRKGVIRAQTPWNGDEKLQDENHLRTLIDSLLKEGATATKRPVAKKKAS